MQGDETFSDREIVENASQYKQSQPILAERQHILNCPKTAPKRARGRPKGTQNSKICLDSDNATELLKLSLIKDANRLLKLSPSKRLALGRVAIMWYQLFDEAFGSGIFSRKPGNKGGNQNSMQLTINQAVALPPPITELRAANPQTPTISVNSEGGGGCPLEGGNGGDSPSLGYSPEKIFPLEKNPEENQNP